MDDKTQKIRYVDLDGTLAYYTGWRGSLFIGDPIPEMLQKVKNWISDGDEVIIYTARMGPPSQYVPEEQREAAKKAIEVWCQKHIGQVLPVTAEKGIFDVVYDDRACQIVPNTGLSVQECLLRRIKHLKASGLKDTRILDFVVDFLNGLA